jgi:hypothetical protein
LYIPPEDGQQGPKHVAVANVYEQTSWKAVARGGASNNLDNTRNRMQNTKIKLFK